MAEEEKKQVKRYYWLKMPDDFFASKRIKRLRALAGGDTYTIIYLKLQLKSLKTDGYLYFDNIMDDFIDELALDIDEQSDDVRVTVNYLLSVGLMESRDDGDALSLPYLQGMIGSESVSAQRVRQFRERKKEKALQCNTEPLQCNDIYNYNYNQNNNHNQNKYYEVDSIIDYLNEKANTNYRHSDTSRKHIKARLNDGFTVDDCKTVIDKKCAEWLGNDMEKYLRPETLFGSKFENYLNAPLAQKKATYSPHKVDAPDYMSLDHVLEGLE